MNGLTNVLRDLVSRLPGTFEPAFLFMRERLDSTTTCSAAYRGAKRRTEGGAGVADTLTYCRKDAAGAYAWSAAMGITTFSDAEFRVQDNGDATKQLAFELSGVTTGTTRTLTVPNASGTIALTSNIFTIIGSDSATWDPANMAAGTSTATTMTITGATTTDQVSCSLSSIAGGNVILSGSISAANTVTARLHHTGAGADINISSGTLTCVAFRP